MVVGISSGDVGITINRLLVCCGIQTVHPQTPS